MPKKTIQHRLENLAYDAVTSDHDGRVWVLRSDVHSLLEKAYAMGRRDQRDANRSDLQAQLEEEQTRNAIFSNCLHRGLREWQKHHPDAKFWPDGADNLAWIFDRLSTAEKLIAALIYPNVPSEQDVRLLCIAIGNGVISPELNAMLERMRKAQVDGRVFITPPEKKEGAK